MNARLRNVRLRMLARRELQVRPRQPIVSFSFDDVLADATHAGLQIMQRHGIQATWYVATGLIGSAGPHGPHASESDLKRLQGTGQEIAAHGVSHRMVTKLQDSEILQEADACEAGLRSVLGQAAAPHYAYPEGAVTLAAKRLLGKRYLTLRTVRPGIMRGRCDASLLRGTPIYGGASAFPAIATMLDDLAARPGWLIFYAHDIRDNHSAYGATAELLEKVAAHSRALGVQCLSVGQAYQQLTQGSAVTVPESDQATRNASGS